MITAATRRKVFEKTLHTRHEGEVGQEFCVFRREWLPFTKVPAVHEGLHEGVGVRVLRVY
jgi:hypothetical protein